MKKSQKCDVPHGFEKYIFEDFFYSMLWTIRRYKATHVL